MISNDLINQKIYTEEQVSQMSPSVLVALLNSLQTIIQNQAEQQKLLEERYDSLNHSMQIMLEQLADLKRRRFGRSSEKFTNEVSGQMFLTVNDLGQLCFNEAEAITDGTARENGEEEKEAITYTRSKKKKGKRDEDLKGLPTEQVYHTMTDEQLARVYPDEDYKRLPDKIEKELIYKPAEVKVLEHHIAVYSGAVSETMVEADHPRKLLRVGLVSPSLGAGFITDKFVKALPYNRQSQVLRADGIPVTRQDFSRWEIELVKKYLHRFGNYMIRVILESHVIQGDETPLRVLNEPPPNTDKSYMWVFRTGVLSASPPVIIYMYLASRKGDFPRNFLRNYNGICVTDGYQVYHSADDQIEGLTVAGCWAHGRRRFDEALKAMPADKRSESVAAAALGRIQKIFKIEGTLKDLSPDERLEVRKTKIAPLVNELFIWVNRTKPSLVSGTKTDKGMTYLLNQEKYLRVFLTDGEVPIDNNGAERAIRPFTVGRKNWEFCNTPSGAHSSAMLYSIVETAKANGLNVFKYLEYVLTFMAQHQDDKDEKYIEELLPWSDSLPEECHSKAKK